MAEYKNYFNLDNPLNLYGNNFVLNLWAPQLGRNPSKSQSLLKQPEETEEDYNEKLKREEDEYQEYLRRQAERNKLNESQKESDFFLRNLVLPDYQDSLDNKEVPKDENENKNLFKINPETGELNYPKSVVNKKLWNDTMEYGELELDVNTLSKAIKSTEGGEENPDNDYILALKDEVKKDLLNRGSIKDELEFNLEWDKLDAIDRMTFVIAALGRKYFTGDQLEEFVNADAQYRFDMLASYLKNNPYYESLTSRHKRDIDWGDNEFSKDWKLTTDYATNRFLYGITGGNGWDIFSAFKDVLEGGALAAAGNLGNLAGGILGSVGEYTQSRIEGMGFEEDVDDLIARRADAYLEKKSLDIYETLMVNLDDQQKQEFCLEFNNISSQLSNEYKAEIGTSLTELGTDETLKEYAKLIAARQLYGGEAADKNLLEFWSNTIAHRQSTTDKILRTAGTFFNSGVADAAAFAGVILNPLFMPIDHHGSINPEDWTVEGEGYSDALVKRNPLVSWATNLLETGAWSSELQDKYKDLGVNALLIYKSVSDQNAFVSANDFYDIVGQYGFTAATTLLSLGGSSVVRGLALKNPKTILKGLEEGASKEAKKKALRRASLVALKDARNALKAGLADGATEAEITAAKEIVAKLNALRLYKGNLAVGAMMGTAEGALEAKSTYNTFMEDNLKAVDLMLKPYEDAINNNLNVREYMLSLGYEPSVIILGEDGSSSLTDFSPEQYELARQELLAELDARRNDILARIEDNAADAAFANFISNSAINGFLNVFAKEAIMSRDVREASRMAKGRNKLKDLIDVVKKGDSWEAVVKKAVTDNGKRNLWLATKDITGKALKNAFGEFGEEYSQTLSDLASRDALQYDLNLYISTIFNKDAREAFLTDWAGMLNAGLNSIITNATDLESIKAGIFGGASSLIGGFSPAGLGAAAKGFFKGRTDLDKGFWGTTKWIGKNLGNLYQWGIGEAFRDYNEEYQTALRLAESTNAWLNNTKNQELLTHMGGAAGFKKAIEDAIIAGDDFNAHDGKLGLAVENVYMLLALKDTDYGKAMQLKIRENAELLDLINDETKFDSNGNYIGNVHLVEIPGTEQYEALGDTDVLLGPQAYQLTLKDWVSTAINTYKNQLGDATRSTNLTDKLIAERIGQNAKDLIELQNEVIKALQRILNIFRNDNLDPLAELAFVYALMSLKNTKERRDSLLEKLYNSTHDTSLLSDYAKSALKESGLDSNAINFLVEYGSLEKAHKLYKALKEQSNQANEDALNKKLNKERRAAAKRRSNYLFKEAEALGRLIALEEERRKRETVERTIENNSVNPITITENAKTIFSAGDIAAMSNLLRAHVIANKQKYSEEQQKVIDDFLDISRRTLSSKDGDIALTNEEVAKDYIDLATLERRADAYDRHLTEYINNPYFLSTTASTYREKERTRTLRHLYKEDLQMRENESVLDYKERLEKKMLLLKDLGKMEDASILNKLMHENKGVAQLLNNIMEALKAAVIYKMLQNVKDEDINLLDAVVQTLIANSGMSLDEIKALLDESKTSEIAQYLSSKTSDGLNTLDKTLTKRGLKALGLTDDLLSNEAKLAPIILDIKNFLDFYSTISKDESNSSEEPKVVGNKGTAPSSSSLSLPGAGAGAPPPSSDLRERKQKVENTNIVITAPGKVDLGSKLGTFLNSRGVNENVKNLDNTRDPHVHFAVVSSYGEPVVFAVQKTDKAVPDKTLNINGTNYQIIGVIGAGLSDTLTDLGKQTFDSLLPNEEGKLLSTDKGVISTEFGRITDPKYMSEQNLESPINLAKIYITEEELDKYARDLVNNGTRTEATDKESSKLKDGTGHEVRFALKENKDELEYIENFPIGNSTLLEVLQNIDFSNSESVRQAINTLKLNEFFLAYFDAWTDPTIQLYYGGVKTPTDELVGVLYKKLLGDFIYLGKHWVRTDSDGKIKLSSEEILLNPRLISNDEIRIDGSNKLDDKPENWPHFTFKVPLRTSNTEKQEEMAIQTLANLLVSREGKPNVASTMFRYSYIQLGNADIIHSKNEAAKNREIKRIKGLIKAGLLLGYKTTAVDRPMLVNNPFASSSGSTKSNDSNASQFDPAPRGIVDGGRINPEDGHTEEGNPKSTKLKLEDSFDKAQKEALDIVKTITKNSANIKLKDSNDETYTSTGGVQYSRVTSAKLAFIGADTEEFDASQDDSDLSHAYGNTVDAVLRAALETLNKQKPNNILDSAKLLEEILKDDSFKGKTEVPNWSSYLIQEFLDLVITLYQLCDQEEWTIVPNNVKTFGTADVYSNGSKIGKLPVAGTLDLLVYDKLGIFHIIDIKTKHISSLTSLASSKTEWETLVSSYLGMLQLQYSLMKFGLNYILPVFLSYSQSIGNPVEVDKDKMTVLNYSPTGEPEFKAKKGKSSYTLKDFLYTIDTLDFKGYEYDRLSESDKKRFIPNTSDTNGPILSGGAASGSSNMRSNIGNTVGSPTNYTKGNLGLRSSIKNNSMAGSTIKEELDDLSWDSRKTTRQAKYTEFINNHIAPIVKVKIGIVSKALSIVKRLLEKGGKELILKLELANTFFNGDTVKLQLILKQKNITLNNISEIINTIKKYYESYIQNESLYVNAITKRHNISKAVYNYLKGNLTYQLLEDELSKYQATPSSITELVEYMASPNKEDAATKLLSKLESSKATTDEKYKQDLNALNTTIESMQAKLDFLNSSLALRMLINRINSVQEAVYNGSYEEHAYTKNSTIEDLLNKKSGSYGALKLLRGISLNTKNSNFKRLANILLRLIKEKNITIPITVEDGSLNFVEGTTRGKNITILKTSLDTYEHLERVLLHEILHAVVEASPEMRNTLQELLKQSITSIQKTTGKSESQIKEEYYGLSNVDEFISEFFTNYAFQETLKSIGSEDYSNIFDKFIGTLKNKITGDKSLYNQISEAMETILNSTNIESTYRETETEEEYKVTDNFEDLSGYILQAILSRGISKDEYDDMTSIEQEHLKACCK